jgi:hypothetical protein
LAKGIAASVRALILVNINNLLQAVTNLVCLAKQTSIQKAHDYLLAANAEFSRTQAVDYLLLL